MIDMALAYAVLQDEKSSFWLKETIKRFLEKNIAEVQAEIESLNEIFMGAP